MLIWIILIVVVVIVIYDKQDLFSGSNRFDKILDERLAKGEITVEEYKKIKEGKND
jgi:uncharacterized membrane protein